MALDSRKRATSIPEHRVAILRPFARFLDDIGVPIERAFRRARLPIYALENVGNFVPSHGFYALLINGARSDGIEDLGFLVGEKYGASSVDPKLTDLLRQSPTLYRGLERAIDLSNKVVTNSRMWLSNSSKIG